MTVEQLIDQINQLSQEERSKLLRSISSPVTIIFSGSSVVNNGVSIQVGQQGDLKEALEKIPPEALGELIKAIAQYIATNRL
ncbi:hypothetical protein PCC8801_4461 (plasmid) [Rippkaea orientalis PCC 8801]|uniref:Uncharacterized protein n=1 Tax=Rippkaea orientalis (strain PCC 8801 / RF-1) TaxID=41431 RepID=B7K6F8_RIPO1|nr:hypothetical protein [Rippkaea orientalis]ACK68380.1 hypothetical protein PCC8801_4461 [Rippkaea orientalis PCC 8801]